MKSIRTVRRWPIGGRLHDNPDPLVEACSSSTIRNLSARERSWLVPGCSRRRRSPSVRSAEIVRRARISRDKGGASRNKGGAGSGPRLKPVDIDPAYVGARNSPWSQPRVWSDFIGSASATSVLCTYSHAGHSKVRNSKPDTAKLMRVSIIRSAWHFGQAAPGRWVM